MGDYEDTPSVFPDPARRQEFWERFETLMNDFPEIMTSFDAHLGGDIDERGILFNPDSPKFWQGFVLVVSVRNVDHWESMFIVDPPEQSGYMTSGMLTCATAMNLV